MPAILELLIVRAFCLLNYWFRASEDTALETLSGKGAQTKVFFYSNHYCWFLHLANGTMGHAHCFIGMVPTIVIYSIHSKL
jgi:hypothetical protein